MQPDVSINSYISLISFRWYMYMYTYSYCPSVDKNIATPKWQWLVMRSIYKCSLETIKNIYLVDS